MESPSPKWKRFERLVAAIQKAADEGADVKWNDKIDGRQFDVTVRFKKGLYSYLTVIECKDQADPVKVEKVDAFVTKAAGAKANHAVMASTSGFQEGAKQQARVHNMTLLHISDSSEIDLTIFGAKWGVIVDSLHFRSIELEYADGQRTQLPQESDAMTYYVNKVVLQQGNHARNLDQAIQSLMHELMALATTEYEDHEIICPPGTNVVSPDDGEVTLKPTAKVHVSVGIVKAKTITGPFMFEPHLLSPKVNVLNVNTGENTVFNLGDLGTYLTNIFEQGKFYEQPAIGSFFYCERISGDLADIYLIESYQLGMLIQAELVIATKHANFYNPVSDGDKGVLRRLQRRLD
jgi:hypothetical protein